MTPTRDPPAVTPAGLGRQRGATLFVTLIMLVMLTLIVFTAARLSTSNLMVVGNLQHQEEALTAANVAIEHVMSTDFTIAPQAVSVAVDLEKDGSPDFNVQVDKPVCLRARVIPTAELDVAKPADQGCFIGMGTGAGGLAGAAGTTSFCAETLWEIRATATHAQTGAKVIARQGIARRISATLAASSCS
jgi:hypothetical protein